VVLGTLSFLCKLIPLTPCLKRASNKINSIFLKHFRNVTQKTKKKHLVVPPITPARVANVSAFDLKI